MHGKNIRGLLQKRLKGQILVYLKIITFFELCAICNVVCSGSFQGFIGTAYSAKYPIQWQRNFRGKNDKLFQVAAVLSIMVD